MIAKAKAENNETNASLKLGYEYFMSRFEIEISVL